MLILGVLLAIAIPSYLRSMRMARANTANTNSRMIAAAVQARNIATGAGGYASFGGPSIQVNALIIKDLGGVVPTNPCTGGNLLDGTDYTVTANAVQWTIVPEPNSSCDPRDLKTTQLGG
jgi:type II secretory pathway pseudopilin PulG